MRANVDQLRDALTDLDEAVACCLAVAELAADTTSEVREQAAAVAVTDYEAADAVVEALLDAIIAAGGVAGLADSLEAACDRAAARVGRAWGQGAKQQAVAAHAYERAAERAQRVTVALALPYWRRRVEASDAAA